MVKCNQKIRTVSAVIRDRKLYPKNLAEFSGEFSGAISLKPLFIGSLNLFRKFFGTVRVISWFWGSFLAL